MNVRPAKYTIQTARLRDENSETIGVSTVSPPWLPAMVVGSLFALVGAASLSTGREGFLLGMIMVSMAVTFAALSPLKIGMTFSLAAHELVFNAIYLWRGARPLEVRAPFSQIARFGFRPVRWGKPRVVEILLGDGAKFILDFGRNTAEAERLVSRFAAMGGTQSAPLLNSSEAIENATTAESRASMIQQLRSWSIWLLIMGAAQIVAAGGFSSWGVLLISVGLASFYFREASMFIVYAITVAWAGLSNLLYGEASWKIFSVLQAYWAFQLFQQFRRYRGAELAAPPTGPAEDVRSRAARLFPPLALILGLGGLAGFVITIIGIVINAAFVQSDQLFSILGWIEPVAIYSAILGFATGLAGQLAGHPNRWASLVGCGAGALTMLAELGLGLWGTL